MTTANFDKETSNEYLQTGRQRERKRVREMEAEESDGESAEIPMRMVLSTILSLSSTLPYRDDSKVVARWVSGLGNPLLKGEIPSLLDTTT